MEKTTKKPKTTQRMVFSEVDMSHRVPVPDWTESTARSGNTYVTYGKDNRFPKYLMELVLKSPTLSSIINGTVEMIKSHTMILSDAVHERGELTYWPYMNAEGQSVEEFVADLAHDYRIFGMYAINVIYNKLGKVSELYTVPVEFVRMNDTRDTIWFSKKFGNYTSTGDMIIYDKFDRNNISPDYKSQMYVYVNSGHRQTYGISPQTGCLSDLVSESLAADYIKNELGCGLAARHIVSLPNSYNLPDDQKAVIEEGIKSKFTGVENAGAFMLWFDEGTDSITVNKIDADKPNEIYESIRTAARNNIFIANQATPNLFGDPSSTTGFSSQEYEGAFTLYDKMVLAPIRKAVERTFETLFGQGMFTISPAETKLTEE